MKKLSILLLFTLALLVSCQALNVKKPEANKPEAKKSELVLLYSCGGTDRDIAFCYRDLLSDQPETSFPFRDYYFVKWISSEKVLLSKYAGSEDSEEYYTFDLGTKSIDCVTCSLNSVSYKSLSPSMQKVFLFTDDGTSLVELSSPANVRHILSDRDISWLDWSPDDSFLVFVDQMHLYRFDLQDQSLIELLPKISAIQIFDVEISPRGDKVAFYLLDENQNFSLATVSVDGTDFQVLADLTPKIKRYIDSETASTSFAWSPTGEQIAFTAPQKEYADSRSSVFVVDLDQGKPKLILDSPTIKFSPVWSADGSLIAFVDQSSGQDIWTITPDGTRLINQTNTPTRIEYWPAWK